MGWHKILPAMVRQVENIYLRNLSDLTLIITNRYDQPASLR